MLSEEAQVSYLSVVVEVVGLLVAQESSSTLLVDTRYDFFTVLHRWTCTSDVSASVAIQRSFDEGKSQFFLFYT